MQSTPPFHTSDLVIPHRCVQSGFGFFALLRAYCAMTDFSILVLPRSFASGVATTLDILASAANLARGAGCAPPTWRVYSTRKDVLLSNGFKVDAQPLKTKSRSKRGIWIVPGFDVRGPEDMLSRVAEPDAMWAAGILQRHVRAGGAVAAACSGVFLLHTAGVLNGRRATTTWWFGGLLQQMAPLCAVDVDQMVVADGNVITAGAAFAQIDLMLHLLRTRFNPSLADAVSRALVIDGRQSQAQFIVPAMLANGNALVGKVVQRFESKLPNPPTIAELAADFCMSTRTLSRHIKAATGRSVSSLLQSVRINRARMLLETSKLNVEQIASKVGYGDTTALRRLMRKMTGSTPRQFRPAVYNNPR
jgi:transcriptional regulator GlxA family with amidase domain